MQSGSQTSLFPHLAKGGVTSPRRGTARRPLADAPFRLLIFSWRVARGGHAIWHATPAHPCLVPDAVVRRPAAASRHAEWAPFDEVGRCHAAPRAEWVTNLTHSSPGKGRCDLLLCRGTARRPLADAPFRYKSLWNVREVTNDSTFPCKLCTSLGVHCPTSWCKPHA